MPRPSSIEVLIYFSALTWIFLHYYYYYLQYYCSYFIAKKCTIICSNISFWKLLWTVSMSSNQSNPNHSNLVKRNILRLYFYSQIIISNHLIGSKLIRILSNFGHVQMLWKTLSSLELVIGIIHLWKLQSGLKKRSTKCQFQFQYHLKLKQSSK